jgi:LacI family transcriptional regulator
MPHDIDNPAEPPESPETPSRAPARKPASIREVARRAGVSPTTVSHALSGKRHVAPETAARIRALVPEVGYVPYFATRALQSGKSFVIGLVVPDISNQFFGEIAIGVEGYANDQDYGVSLCTSQSDPRREKRYFNMLRSGAIDGLIYNAADAGWDDALPTIAAHFPVVVVDERVPGLESSPVVASDHRQGGFLAGTHLKELGHARVAVISGPRGLASTEDRTAGFREVYPDAFHLIGDYSESSGHLLASIVMQSHPETTAIFAGNDLMAFGAIAELHQLGYSVPGDVSVIGFDDVDFAARVTPALTTIRQPAIELGKRSAQLLLDHLIHEHELDVRHLTLPVRLVARESTGVPRPQ